MRKFGICSFIFSDGCLLAMSSMQRNHIAATFTHNSGYPLPHPPPPTHILDLCVDCWILLQIYRYFVVIVNYSLYVISSRKYLSNISHKYLPQIFPTNISHKYISQMFLTDTFHKYVLQICLTNISHKHLETSI